MEGLSAWIMRKGGWWVKRYFEAHQQSHIQQQRGVIALTLGSLGEVCEVVTPSTAYSVAVGGLQDTKASVF